MQLYVGKISNRTAQQEEYNWKMGLNGFPVEPPPPNTFMMKMSTERQQPADTIGQTPPVQPENGKK